MDEFDRATFKATFNSVIWFGRLWIFVMIATLVVLGSEWVLVQSSQKWGHGGLSQVIEPTWQAIMDQSKIPVSLALISLVGLMMSLEYYRWSRVFWLLSVYTTHLLVVGSMF